MSTPHNKQGEQWPERLVALRTEEFGVTTAIDAGPPELLEKVPNETYVPQSKLEALEQQRREERDALLERAERGEKAESKLSEVEDQREQYEQRAVRAEEVANRLQSILTSLTQQEAVEAVRDKITILNTGLASPDADPLAPEEYAQLLIQAALQTAKEQVDGKADRG